MKRVMVLAVALTLGAAAFAQNPVSAPLVRALESGKYYMELSGEGMEMEVATRGGVTLTRSDEGVMLAANGYTYLLDEDAKTWSAQSGESPAPGVSMSLKEQGRCRINGQDGWYYDAYRAGGTTVTFYYKSDKVAIVDFGGSDGMGPMNLLSFSSAIPRNMYFCVGKEWTDASSQAAEGPDPFALAGIDRKELEKQIREELSGQELPPGVNLDDILKGLNGPAGAESVKSALPAPPICSRPWTDSTPFVEMACGMRLRSISITDRHPLDEPVSTSSVAGDTPTDPEYVTGVVTEAGVRRELDYIAAHVGNKTDAELAEEFLEYNADVNRLLFSGVVTPALAEGIIARCVLHPHPVLLTTAGDMLLELGDGELARKYFEYAIEMDPTVVEPHYGLLEYHLDHNDYSKAKGIVNRILDMGPNGLEDGRAYLYQAMLTARDGDVVGAAGLLFKSLSLGYFDENSLTLLTSLLNRVEETATAAARGRVDLMPVLDAVFSEEHLALLRKGIAWSRESEVHPGSTPLHLGAPLQGNLENLSRYNRGKHDAIEKRAEKYSQLANTDENRSPSVALCLAMGAGEIVQGVQDTTEDILSDPEIQAVIAKYSQAQAAVDQARMSLAMVGSMTSQSYEQLTRTLGKQYGVDCFYIPDARPFWCLYALDRYYRIRLRYASGALAEGCMPPQYIETNAKDDATRSRYEERESAMIEVQIKQEIDLGQECQERYNQWLEAHLDASEEACRRAERRFFLPYYKMMFVEHPLARLDQCHVPDSEETARHWVDFYQGSELPVMQAWWEDIDRYSQYCLDPAVRNWFRFNALASMHEEWALIYEQVATKGEALFVEREQIERKLAELMEQEYKDRAASLQEWDESLRQEVLAEALLPESPLFGMLSDLNVSMNTPVGVISVGYMNGKWGLKMEDGSFTMEDRLRYGMERIFGKDLMHCLGINTVDPVKEAKIREALEQYAHGKAEEYAGMLIGSGPASLLSTVIKARRGNLVKTSTERNRDELVRDRNGNVWTKRSTTTSVDFNGVLQAGQENIQAGRVKVRKDTFTLPAGPININLGQTSRIRH